MIVPRIPFYIGLKTIKTNPTFFSRLASIQPSPLHNIGLRTIRTSSTFFSRLASTQSNPLHKLSISNRSKARIGLLTVAGLGAKMAYHYFTPNTQVINRLDNWSCEDLSYACSGGFGSDIKKEAIEYLPRAIERGAMDKILPDSQFFWLNNDYGSEVREATKARLLKIIPEGRLDKRLNRSYAHAHVRDAIQERKNALSREALKEVKELALAIDTLFKDDYKKGDPRGGILYPQAFAAAMLMVLNSVEGDAKRIYDQLDSSYLASQKNKLSLGQINEAYRDFDTIRTFAPMEHVPEKSTSFEGEFEIRLSHIRLETVQKELKIGQWVQDKNGETKTLTAKEVERLKSSTFENFNKEISLVEGELVNVAIKLTTESSVKIRDAAASVIEPRGFKVGRLTGLKETKAEEERHVTLGLRMPYTRQMQEDIDKQKKFIGRTAGRLDLVTPSHIRTGASAVSMLDKRTEKSLILIQEKLQSKRSDKLPPLHITQGNMPIKASSLEKLKKVIKDSDPQQAKEFLKSQGLDLDDTISRIQERKS